MFRKTIPVLIAALAVAAGCGDEDEPAEPASGASEIPEAAKQATVALMGERLGIPVGGSGFVYDLERGLVATSAWNVTAVDELSVRVGVGTTPIPAQVQGIAPCEDIAVLELPEQRESLAGLEQIALGTSSELKADQAVVALGYGNQFQSPDRETLQRSQGTISDPALEQATIAPDLPEFPALIEDSASLDPGFSGGPLLDEKGEAIGMLVTSDLAEPTPSFAIPVQRLRGILEGLATGAQRLDVGWYLRPLSTVDLETEFQLFLKEKLEAAGFTAAEAAEHVEKLKLPNGMYVLATANKSAVDDANIFPGDMITKIEGDPVSSMADVCEALDDAGAGTEIEVDGVAITSSTRIADIGERFTVVIDIPEE